MRQLLSSLLALALCAALPVPKGFDSSYPNAWPDRNYRQSRLNGELRQLGWPYRVYQSIVDGSCLAARSDKVQGMRSLRRGEAGPALAFGCQRLPAESRQDLSVHGDMIVVARDDGMIFTGAEDPYHQVGRYESGDGRLLITDRARVLEVLKVVQAARGPEYARRIEHELENKIHDMGDGKMTELTGEADDGHWRYWVRTEDSRPGDPPELFFEDGQTDDASAKNDAHDARDDYEDGDDGPP